MNSSEDGDFNIKNEGDPVFQSDNATTEVSGKHISA